MFRNMKNAILDRRNVNTRLSKQVETSFVIKHIQICLQTQLLSLSVILANMAWVITVTNVICHCFNIPHSYPVKKTQTPQNNKQTNQPTLILKSFVRLQTVETKFSDKGLTTINHFGEDVLMLSSGMTNSVHYCGEKKIIKNYCYIFLSEIFCSLFRLVIL